jgi:hypothetical protein
LLATLVMLVLAGVTAIWRKEHPPEMEPYWLHPLPREILADHRGAFVSNTKNKSPRARTAPGRNDRLLVVACALFLRQKNQTRDDKKSVCDSHKNSREYLHERWARVLIYYKLKYQKVKQKFCIKRSKWAPANANAH